MKIAVNLRQFFQGQIGGLEGRTADDRRWCIKLNSPNRLARMVEIGQGRTWGHFFSGELRHLSFSRV